MFIVLSKTNHRVHREKNNIIKNYTALILYPLCVLCGFMSFALFSKTFNTTMFILIDDAFVRKDHLLK